jgi:hypothetical protein
MGRKRKEAHIFEAEEQFDGKTYSAKCCVLGDMLTVVVDDYGWLCAHKGADTDLTVRMLFREILQDAKDKRKLNS